MKIRLLILCSLVFISSTSYSQESFESLFTQATHHFQHGAYQEAIATYNKALTYNNRCPQLYFNLGLIYLEQEQFDNAHHAFKQAIELDTTYTKAYFYLGTTLQKQNKKEEAITTLKKVITLDAHHIDALTALGRLTNELSQFNESANYFKQATTLQPRNANLLLEYANTLNMANKTEQALAVYYTILNIIPNNSSILYNIAYTLKKLNRITEALPVYRAVLEQDPDNAEAHFSLGLAYLATGNFDLGWPEYEWRWKRDHNGDRNLSKPLWDGSSLQGKTILLHAEQGLGDSFQFIRYAKIAKDLGGTVVVALQGPLVQLFKLCPYIDVTVSLNDPLPHYDVHAPLLTVPYIVKTREETIPHEIPYLYADNNLIEIWKEKLSHDKHFKIGICWQGNSQYSTHFLRTAVAAKSITLTTFLPYSHYQMSVYTICKK